MRSVVIFALLRLPDVSSRAAELTSNLRTVGSWVDGVDLDEKPDKLGIDVGLEPGVGADDGGAAAPSDD